MYYIGSHFNARRRATLHVCVCVCTCACAENIAYLGARVKIV